MTIACVDNLSKCIHQLLFHIHTKVISCQRNFYSQGFSKERAKEVIKLSQVMVDKWACSLMLLHMTFIISITYRRAHTLSIACHIYGTANNRISMAGQKLSCLIRL